jgi:GWxTD domain-containing protein
MGRPKYSPGDLAEMAARDPLHYLPLLADAQIDKGQWEAAGASYERYLALLDANERGFYEDVSLLTTPSEQAGLDAALTAGERDRLLRGFWLLSDPTPTTAVNERRIEHYRRVHHARANFAEGVEAWHGRGWDRRGDVHIRFGKPDHRTFSDFLVFETAPGVVKVKNRLNTLAYDALDEVATVAIAALSGSPARGQNDDGVSQAVTIDVRGIPTFPLPRRTSVFGEGSDLNARWESWIYAEVGGGIELTFIDPAGKGFYDYAAPPHGSRNFLLWTELAPETVVGRVVARSPSAFAFDHGGTPLDLHVATAAFRGRAGGTRLEVYLGVPLAQVGRAEGDSLRASVERTVVLYDGDFRLAATAAAPAEAAWSAGEAAGPGTLLIDQADVELSAGDYLLAVEVRDPVSGRLQIHRGPVSLATHAGKGLSLSGLEPAGRVTDLPSAARTRFMKGSLEVVPLPSRTFLSGRPASLYYEIYNLSRDPFGRTRVRIDYEARAEREGLSITGALGRLIGRQAEEGLTRVSYEHDSDRTDEAMVVHLDLPGTGSRPVRLTVRATDLNAPSLPPVEQSIDVAFGD